MKEWKNLHRENLPHDILTGDYEFKYFSRDSNKWEESICKRRFEILNAIELEMIDYKYCKSEPKQPSHKEIMSKWWKGSLSL